jgi:hypothetical protein
MRKLLIALAISLVPSLALAAHVGGGHGGGHMGGGGGGHVAGGHMSGGWSGARMGGSGFSSRAAVGTARVGGWNGARWNGANRNHGRFVHRRGRGFFVGGGPWWVGDYDSCSQWVATPWGLRQRWVCGDYGYY